MELNGISYRFISDVDNDNHNACKGCAFNPTPTQEVCKCTFPYPGIILEKKCVEEDGIWEIEEDNIWN